MPNNEIPMPPGVTWREIQTEFDLSEAAAIRAGFVRGVAERRAEAIAKNPGASPADVAAARLEVESAERDQDLVESRVYRMSEALLRYQPADAQELLSKYAHLLKMYSDGTDASQRFLDFHSDIERFAGGWGQREGARAGDQETATECDVWTHPSVTKARDPETVAVRVQTVGPAPSKKPIKAQVRYVDTPD